MRTIYFINCAVRLLQGTIFFYFPLLLKEMGFNGWQIGILLSIYTFTPILLSIPAGLLNDRLNSRTLITFSLLGYASFYFFLTRERSFFSLVPVFLIGGASANILVVSLQALALKVVGIKERGRKLGFFQGFALMGYAAGLLTGGSLMAMKLLFPLLSGAAIVYLLLGVYALFLQETTSVSINMLEYARDFGQKKVLLFCLIYSVFALHWGSETSCLSLFLTQHFGLSKLQIALYMAPPLFLLGITSIVTGWLMDRSFISTRILVITAFLASGLGQVLMVVPNIYLSVTMRALHEMGDGIAGITFAMGMASMFRVEKIGGLSAAVTFTNIMAQTAGILLFSRMGELYGYQYPTICGGLSVLLACILVLTLGKKLTSL